MEDCLAPPLMPAPFPQLPVKGRDISSMQSEIWLQQFSLHEYGCWLIGVRNRCFDIASENAIFASRKLKLLSESIQSLILNPTADSRFNVLVFNISLK